MRLRACARANEPACEISAKLGTVFCPVFKVRRDRCVTRAIYWYELGRVKSHADEGNWTRLKQEERPGKDAGKLSIFFTKLRTDRCQTVVKSSRTISFSLCLQVLCFLDRDFKLDKEDRTKLVSKKTSRLIIIGYSRGISNYYYHVVSLKKSCSPLRISNLSSTSALVFLECKFSYRLAHNEVSTSSNKGETFCFRLEPRWQL